MRDLSSSARSALFSSDTSEVFLVLLEVSHAELAEPLRFVYNNEAVVMGGNTFFPAAFDFVLPDDVEGRLSSARLSICNVDRRVVEAVRAISSPPSVRVWVVLAGNPEQVEVGPYDFYLLNVRYDARTVSGELVVSSVCDRELPALRYSPYDFPALFL